MLKKKSCIKIESILEELKFKSFNHKPVRIYFKCVKIFIICQTYQNDYFPIKIYKSLENILKVLKALCLLWTFNFLLVVSIIT